MESFLESFLGIFSSGYVALFAVIAVGYIVGKISVRGVSLDVSAVIFVALLFGHFGVVIPKVIQDIGLVLFIFTIGIQAGPGFFDSLKKHGVKLAMLSAILILSSGVVAVVCLYAFELDVPIVAGLLAGSLTSTPGLASATDVFGGESSIGYGIAYPFGVIGVILFLRLLPILLRVNIKKEEKIYEEKIHSETPKVNYKHFEITNKNITGKSLLDLKFRKMTGAAISRVLHDGIAVTPNSNMKLYLGDVVRVVGDDDSLEKAGLLLGDESDKEIKLSGDYDVQGILVTNPKVVNKTIAELNLQSNYNATITRIRRAGIDIQATPKSKLRFGDKLVVAFRAEDRHQLFKTFGNDDKKLSDTNILPIALGIIIGVVLGHYTFLGLTGGVLIAALVLSRIGKTGPILWTMSSAGNTLLREIGLIFFLAVVGTQAGATLVDTYLQYGYKLFIVGGILTLLPMIIMTIVARLVFKTNLLTLIGALAGAMTSTPGLAAISPMTNSNAPQIAYATAYPLAMVLLVFVIKMLALFA